MPEENIKKLEWDPGTAVRYLKRNCLVKKEGDLELFKLNGLTACSAYDYLQERGIPIRLKRV